MPAADKMPPIFKSVALQLIGKNLARSPRGGGYNDKEPVEIPMAQGNNPRVKD
jgi:hypothetical protein